MTNEIDYVALRNGSGGVLTHPPSETEVFTQEELGVIVDGLNTENGIDFLMYEVTRGKMTAPIQKAFDEFVTGGDDRVWIDDDEAAHDLKVLIDAAFTK